MATVHYLASAFSDSVNEIDNNLRSLKNEAEIATRAMDLQRKIKELEQKEIQMLKALGIEGNDLNQMLNEANRRIQEYNNITQFTFSGQELYNKFVAPYQDKTIAEAKELNEAFRKLVLQELKNENSVLPERIAKMKGGEIYETVMKILNRENASNKNMVYSVKGMKGITKENLANLDINLFTSEQKNRAIKIAKNFQKKLKNNNVIEPEVDVKTSNSSIDTFVNWRSVTGGRTGKEVKGKDDVIIKAQQKLLDGILSILPTNGNYQTRFKNAYNQVIGKHSTAIFVGGNANEITGLLGEIQAMIYLDVIINGNRSNMSNIDWIGGITEDGSKPRADLLLQTLGKNYGIQVKNTTAVTDTRTYHFTTLNAANFLDRLAQFGLSTTTKEYLENMYAAYVFNVGVAKQNGVWVKVSNEQVKDKDNEFVPARIKLDKLPEIADELFEAFAAELMYMSTSEFVDANMDSANVLYMLGSAGIKVASQILAEKDQQVMDAKNNSIKRFNIDVDFSKSSAYTIADAYNANKSALKTNRSAHSVDYTLSQIKLTSSYTFSF